METARADDHHRRRWLGLQLLVVATVAWGPSVGVVGDLFAGFDAIGMIGWGVAATGLVAVLSWMRHGGRVGFRSPETRKVAGQGVLMDVTLTLAVWFGVSLSLGLPPGVYDYDNAFLDGHELAQRVWLDAIRVGVVMGGLGLVTGRGHAESHRRWSLPLTWGMALLWLGVEAPELVLQKRLLASVCAPGVAFAIAARRQTVTTTERWLLEHEPHIVRIRLPGFQPRRVFRMLGEWSGAFTLLAVGVGLLSTELGLAVGLVDGWAGELRIALGIGLVVAAVLQALASAVGVLFARQGAVDLTLTPTGARIGRQRIEASRLVLDLVADSAGSMLVVGDGVVLSADVVDPRFPEMLAQVRAGLVRDSRTDQVKARQALESFVSAEASAANQWLEVGRRRIALAQLVIPAVMALGFAGLLLDDRTFTAWMLTLVPALFFLAGVVRVVRMARAAQSSETVAPSVVSETVEPEQATRHQQASRARRAEGVH